MSPELEQAIKERINLGYTKEQIAAELKAAEYDEAAVEAAYAATLAAMHADVTQAAATLPSTLELLRAAWASTLARKDIFIWLLIPMAILTASDFIFTEDQVMNGSGSLLIAYFAMVVVGFVAMVVVQLAAVYAALQHQLGTSAGTFNESIVWLRGNILAWLWLSLLTVLVIMGAWTLLIIPGIIASIYLLFSQYIFIEKGTRGLEALQQSRQLVYGKFWAVLGRYLLFVLIIVGAIIPLAITFGVLSLAMSEVTLNLVSEILGLFIGSFLGLLGIFFSLGLYQGLKNMPASTVAPTRWYQVYLGVALAGFLLLVALIVYGVTNPQLMEDFQSEIDSATEQPVNDELNAELEAFMQEFEAELSQ